MSAHAENWASVCLGEICAFKYGKGLPEGSRQQGLIPVFGSNGKIGTHNAAITEGPTIVIGRKGSYGEVHMSDGSCWPIDTTYFVDRTATKVDLRWLYHRLKGLGLDSMNRAAAVPGLNREDAYRKTLLLPPAAEQRRIGAILDQADALRAKRRDAIAKLETLAQSIFLEMFGNPIEDGWEMVTIEDIASDHSGAIRTGPFGSQLLHSEFTQSGVAVLGIDNAVHNEFRWGERRFISEQKYGELSRYTVRPGDVLITIMGTCGRCAIVPDDIPVAINTKHLCCITLDKEKCLPTFLHAYFLRHPIARRYLAQKAKGAIMEGLNMGIIKGMPIPRAPIRLQEHFDQRLQCLNEVRASQRLAEARLESLSASLQHHAFRGEL